MEKTIVKGFYKKCQVYTMKSGNSYLRSYDTIVAGYINDKFVKFWDGFSKTTKNHVDYFTESNSGDTMDKKEWEKMKVDNVSNIKWENETDEILKDIKATPVLNERMREFGLYSKYAYGF